MKTLLVLLMMGACACGFAQSLAEPAPRPKPLEAQSRNDAAKNEPAEQTSLGENNQAFAANSPAKRQEMADHTEQNAGSVLYMNYLERATNAVPSPARFSELYLKNLGDLHVTCETNRRSGIISYRVEGCQKTNLPAVFFAVRQMPNRTRIRQGTNSVTVDIRLPTTQ